MGTNRCVHERMEEATNAGDRLNYLCHMPLLFGCLAGSDRNYIVSKLVCFADLRDVNNLLI